ncbi:MAG: HD domain-containing protein [Syntrophobacterales bacterium]|jgi:hypothetical protein
MVMQQTELNYFKDWFKQYVSLYYELQGDGLKPILLKEQHTKRTCKEIVLLGRESGLNDEDLLLAETAALFHDIGRFPQWKNYSTFIDSASEDHALLGLKVISQHGILMGLAPEERELVQVAIRHHNVRKLPLNLSKRQDRFSRLLRDADKLDIWHVVITELEGHGKLLETLEGVIPTSNSFNRGIVTELMEGKVPDFSSVRNRNDMILLRLGWVFDLNFPMSCRQVLERHYVEKLCSNLPGRRERQEVEKALISYLQKRSMEES